MCIFIGRFDLHPIEISYGKFYTTALGGFCGIIFTITVLALFISKLISVINLDTVYVNSYSYSSYSPVKINNAEISFIVTLLQFNGGTKVLTAKNIFQEGFSIAIQITNSTKIYSNRQTYNLIECEKSQNFCIPSQIDLEVLGDFEDYDQNRQYFKINLNECSEYNEPRCTPCNQSNILMVILELNIQDYLINITSAYNPRPKGDYLTYPFIGIPIHNDNIDVTLKFSEVILKTDTSLFPTFLYYNVEESSQWKFERQLTKKQQYQALSFFFSIAFIRFGNTQIYQRSFKKIDIVLGQVVGISALMGIVLKFFLKRYNQWCYEQQILNSGKGTNYFSFLRYGIIRKPEDKQRIYLLTNYKLRLQKLERRFQLFQRTSEKIPSQQILNDKQPQEQIIEQNEQEEQIEQQLKSSLLESKH